MMKYLYFFMGFCFGAFCISFFYSYILSDSLKAAADVIGEFNNMIQKQHKEKKAIKIVASRN